MGNAFEKARAAYGTGAYDDATLEFLFPQLKESRDEQIRKAIIKSLELPFMEANIDGTDVTHEEAVAWLEKQKDREWSEEDEKQIRQIERIVKFAGCSATLQEKIHNWLKSLRPSWKPSEEQMKALQNAVALTACDKELARLYDQLKKLI